MVDNSATLINQLRVTLGKMEVALGAIGEAIAWTDHDGRVQWSNATFDRLVSRQRFDILGARLLDLLPLKQQGQAISPEVHPVNIAPQGQCKFTGIYEFQQADKKLVLEISSTHIRLKGQEASTVLVLHDITERQRTEEEIRNTLAKEKELGELKSRFVTMASHEFRTPLTTILSSTELLEHYGHRWNEEKKLIHLQRIQAAVKNMTQLLNDVLLIGKAEAGKLEFSPAPLDLIQFCHDLLEEIQLSTTRLQNRCPTHAIAFCTQGECTDAVMDEKLLRHILSNLLSNAIKYSPKGGTVYFDLICQSEAVMFQVRDQGIGIPLTDQEQLFESFHRASNVGTISGTGLGLAIVKQSAGLHGGTIAVESEVGVGTTFTVTLPLNKEG